MAVFGREDGKTYADRSERQKSCYATVNVSDGGIGPMQGQAVVFERYFPEDVPAARTRYKNETRRLYEVLNNRLEKVEFLAGEISIADIATWAWVHTYRWPRIPIDGLEHLTRWINLLGERRAFRQGILLPPLPVGPTFKKQEALVSLLSNFIKANRQP